MLEDLKALDEILMRSSAFPSKYNPIVRRLFAEAKKHERYLEALKRCHDLGIVEVLAITETVIK